MMGERSTPEEQPRQPFSEQELARKEELANWSFLQGKIGRCIVFADEVTPLQYLDDPDRHSFYTGYLQDLGEDEQGYWAQVQITQHHIQLTSTEAVMPGWRDYFNSMHTDPMMVQDALEEMLSAIAEHPETDTWIELPVPEDPRKFYLRDMPALMIFEQQ